MKLARRILLIFFLVALAVLVAQNQRAFGMPIEFSFLRWGFSLVLGFWILLAFAAGVVLFALADAWRGLLLRLEIRRQQNEITRLKADLLERAVGKAPFGHKEPRPE
jgi:uncharacterized integral membrane protein